MREAEGSLNQGKTVDKPGKPSKSVTKPIIASAGKRGNGYQPGREMRRDFSWEQSAKKYLSLYKELLSE